jgi:two-component sensor histidine kinase
MPNKSINLLEELNSISKIHTLKRDDIDNIMIEFAQRITYTFRIEKLSVWLFNQEKDAVISMGEYDLQQRKFEKENIIYKEKHPTYFKAISENEILLAPNVYTNKNTYELADDYFKPNNIISLMDIPLRLEGELVGVMCFEKTGKTERIFSKNDQAFALSLAIVFASNLEARQRRALQYKLNQELKEKNILIKEIHHRVKNNLSVVSSLINLQSGKAKDDYHKSLFDECRNKIHTISGIHDIVYKSKSFSEIVVKEYFESLLTNLKNFFSLENEQIDFKFSIEDLMLNIDQALPMALIINEVVTNSFKHAFNGAQPGKISVEIKREANKLALTISDNGIGFNLANFRSDSLGMEIIRGLVEQLSGEYSYTGNTGTTFSLTFSLK